uniref:Uncharacterized protein n=1 Tax=Palpitomonas bilix TaxID=652834 RepID=A0A7S3G8N8_9EUKA|mmetsp:Transcript_35290/g.91718  ORF Transcript_35290/g.91718 Transcript_35290/m.91718 type:complete len:146 (+) Transcript_35290:765-1202(+)
MYVHSNITHRARMHAALFFVFCFFSVFYLSVFFCVCCLLLTHRDRIAAAYQTLYESSVAFGTRKSLQAEQGKAGLEPKIGGLETEKRDLERQVQELKLKCENIEKRYSEQRAYEEKKRSEEVAYLKRMGEQLKRQLDMVTGSSKK